VNDDCFRVAPQKIFDVAVEFSDAQNNDQFVRLTQGDLPDPGEVKALIAAHPLEQLYGLLVFDQGIRAL